MLVPFAFAQITTLACPPYCRKYIRQGVSVFLDVPLDALARRIAAVGTDSRPLLHFESGDPYTQVVIHLASVVFLNLKLLHMLSQLFLVLIESLFSVNPKCYLAHISSGFHWTFHSLKKES